MPRRILAAAVLACAAATAATAQEDIGKNEFMIACAGCHGETAKGDGPLAGLLNVHTPDLTKLKANNDGTFPFQYAIWMIDGRNLIRIHGPGDMPVWGDRFMASAAANDMAGENPELRTLLVRGRILSLVDYLETIQE